MTKKQVVNKQHHVMPNLKGGWDIKRSGAQRVSAHANTKAEAVRTGREISRNQRTELVIHGKDFRIQRSDSHGNDPCPPKDKK